LIEKDQHQEVEEGNKKKGITLNQNFKYATTIKDNTYNTKYVFILFI